MEHPTAQPLVAALAENSHPYRYIPTNDAYDLWAAVYDTDNNFLTALDTLQLRTRLPPILGMAAAVIAAGVFSPASSASSSEALAAPQIIKVVDLGCGTGRGILLLQAVAAAQDLHLRVTGLDSSPGMLAVCRHALETQLSPSALANTSIIQHDMLHNPTFHHPSPADVPDSTHSEHAASMIPPSALNADLILSTLVVEHIPLHIFFTHARNMLRPGGWLLVTNMHPEMGASTQAGFKDAASGETVRPTSFVHSVSEVVDAAREVDFEVLEGPWELGVEEGMELGPRAARWVGGAKVWFGMLFKLGGGNGL